MKENQTFKKQNTNRSKRSSPIKKKSSDSIAIKRNDIPAKIEVKIDNIEIN